MIATAPVSIQTVKPFVKFDAAIPAAWWWDARVNRYRSFETGQFVSLSTVYDILESVEETSVEVMQNISISLLNEELGMSEWYLTMRRYLTRMHVQNAALGAGGYDQLTQEDFWRIDSMLKEDAARLHRFGQQIEAGLQSEAQIRNRVNMYAGYARIQFFRSQKPPVVGDDEVVIERRKLNPADHCSYCVYLEELGWQPYGTLPVPGESDENWEDDQCYSNCRCDLLREVLKREDAAIRMGKGQKAWVANSFLFKALGKALWDWDEMLHPRWPEGTPTDPFGGEGGGRFMTKPEAEKEATRDKYNRQKKENDGGKPSGVTLPEGFADNYLANAKPVYEAIGQEKNPQRKKYLQRQSALVAAGLSNMIDPSFVNWANNIAPGVFNKPSSGSRTGGGRGRSAGRGSGRPKPSRNKPNKEKKEDKGKDEPEKKKRKPKNIKKDRWMSVRQGMAWLRKNNPNLAAMIEMFRMETGFMGLNANGAVPWADAQGIDYKDHTEFKLKNGNGVIINWDTADNGGITIDGFHLENDDDSDDVVKAIKRMADKGGVPIRINDLGLLDIFKAKGWITDGSMYRPKSNGALGAGPRPAGSLGEGPRPPVEDVPRKSAYKANTGHWEGVLRDEKGQWKDTPGKGKQDTVVGYSFWPTSPKYDTHPWRKGELARTEDFGIKRTDIDEIFLPILTKYDLDAKIAVDLDEYDDLMIDAVAFLGNEEAGRFTFVLREVKEGGDLVASLSLVSITQSMPQLAGAGTEFMQVLIKKLKDLGFESVRFFADVSIGPYAWAKMGFEYELEGAGETYSERFPRWLATRGLSDVVTERPDFNTPKEWADYDVPGVMIDGSAIRNKDVPHDMKLPVGKAFMLDPKGHGYWAATLSLRGKLPARLIKSAQTSEWAAYEPMFSVPVYVLVSQEPLTGFTDAPFWEEEISPNNDEHSSDKAAPRDISHVLRDERGRWIDTPGIGDDAPEETKPETLEIWDSYIEGMKDPDSLLEDDGKLDYKLLPADIEDNPKGITQAIYKDYWDGYMAGREGYPPEANKQAIENLQNGFFAVLEEQKKMTGLSFEEAVNQYAELDFDPANDQAGWYKVFSTEFDDEILADALPDVSRDDLYSMIGSKAVIGSSQNRYEKSAKGNPLSLDGWTEYTRTGDPGFVRITGQTDAVKMALERGYDMSSQQYSDVGAFDNTLAFLLDNRREITPNRELYAPSLWAGSQWRALGRTDEDDLADILTETASIDGLLYHQVMYRLNEQVPGVSLALPVQAKISSVLSGFGRENAADVIWTHGNNLTELYMEDPKYFSTSMLDALEEVTLGDLHESENRLNKAGLAYEEAKPYFDRAFDNEGSMEMVDFSRYFFGDNIGNYKAGEYATMMFHMASPERLGQALEEIEVANPGMVGINNILNLSASGQRFKKNSGAENMIDPEFVKQVGRDLDWDTLNDKMSRSDLLFTDLDPQTNLALLETVGVDGVEPSVATQLLREQGDKLLWLDTSDKDDTYNTLFLKAKEYEKTNISADTGEPIEFVPAAQNGYRRFFDDDLYGASDPTAENLSVREAQKHVITRDINHAVMKDWPEEYQSLGNKHGSYSTARDSLSQWAVTSNGGDMRSLAIQQEAADLFDIDLSPWQQMEIGYAEVTGGFASLPLHSEVLSEQGARHYIRETLKHMKSKTEDWFKDAKAKMPDNVIQEVDGKTYIRLFRGVSLDKDVFEKTGAKMGDAFQYKDNALSSWSLSSMEASQFAKAGYDEVGILMSAMIPVERVLSNARTGFGCLEEDEFVVIGTKGPAWGRLEEISRKD